VCLIGHCPQSCIILSQVQQTYLLVVSAYKLLAALYKILVDYNIINTIIIFWL